MPWEAASPCPAWRGAPPFWGLLLGVAALLVGDGAGRAAAWPRQGSWVPRAQPLNCTLKRMAWMDKLVNRCMNGTVINSDGINALKACKSAPWSTAPSSPLATHSLRCWQWLELLGGHILPWSPPAVCGHPEVCSGGKLGRSMRLVEATKHRVRAVLGEGGHTKRLVPGAGWSAPAAP